MVAERINKHGAVRRVLPLMALIVVSHLPLGCRGGADEAQQALDQPNVVIILVDTLRSDRLSLYGYGKPTSERLEKLADLGTTFERFYSHSATTRPSVATLFTSRYASGHGVVDQVSSALRSDLPVLAEIFDPAIYTRYAFVTNPQIHPLLGFDRGFDRFEPLFEQSLDPRRLKPRDLVKMPAHEVFDSARATLADATDKPFFAYLHLLDPHGPYQPQGEDKRRFTDPGYTGKVTGSLADFGRIQNSGARSGPDLEHFSGLYDGEVAAVDRAIGDFVAWLGESGLLENTHLIITADHGEQFMEHGGTGHGALWEENVRVPLLWIGPGVAAGERVAQMAGLIDIAPTLADLLGVETFDEAFQGRTLRPFLEADHDSHWAERVFLEGPHRDMVPVDGKLRSRLARAVVTSDHKLLALGCTPRSTRFDALEFFDRREDPAELHGVDVAGPQAPPDRAVLDLIALYEALAEHAIAANRGESPEVVLPDDVRRRLEALGYVD